MRVEIIDSGLDFQKLYRGDLRRPTYSRALPPDGKNVLSLCGPDTLRRGAILVSTLVATFEYGVGKIRETADYVRAVLAFAAGLDRRNQELNRERLIQQCQESP